MGVLSYIIAADNELPKRMNKISYSDLDIIGIDCKGLDQIKLSTLNSIINDVPYDPDFMMTDKSMVFAESKDDGPWMWIFPQDFVNNINKIKTELIDSIIIKWSETDEFTLPHIQTPLDDAQEYFTRIQNGCIKCHENNCRLYLWVSL